MGHALCPPDPLELPEEPDLVSSIAAPDPLPHAGGFRTAVVTPNFSNSQRVLALSIADFESFEDDSPEMAAQEMKFQGIW